MINPTRQASELAKTFGIDLNGIVQANKGELMPTMIAFRDELMRIDEFGRAQIIEQLFGKYQFARISALFDNLGQAGSQSLTTMGLAGASASELAAVAANELDVLTNSTSKKFERAVESFKAAIQPIGEAMTKVFTVLIDAASSMLEIFDKLPGPVKTVFAGILALVALAGPLLMLAGVFGNLFGTLIKGVAMIKSRATGGVFEMMTEESVAAEKAGNMLTESFYNEKQALTELIGILNQYEAGLREVAAAAKVVSQTPVMPPPMSTGAALQTKRLIDYRQPTNQQAYDTPSAVFESKKQNSGESGDRTNKQAIPMTRFMQLWRSGAMDEHNNPLNPTVDPNSPNAGVGRQLLAESASRGRMPAGVHQDMLTTQALLRYKQLTGPGNEGPSGSKTGHINTANVRAAFTEVQTKYNRHIEQLLQAGVDAVNAGTLNQNDQGAMRRFFMGRISKLDIEVQGFLKAHFNDMFDLTGKQVLGGTGRHLRGTSGKVYKAVGVEPLDSGTQHISHQAAGKASKDLQISLMELDRMLAMEIETVTRNLGGLATQISGSGDKMEVAIAKTGDDIVNGINVVRARLNKAGNLVFSGPGGAAGAYAQLHGPLPENADKATTAAFNKAVTEFAASVKQYLVGTKGIEDAADTMIRTALVEGENTQTDGLLEGTAARQQIVASETQEKAALQQTQAAKSKGGGMGGMGGLFALGSSISMVSMFTGNDALFKAGLGIDLLATLPMIIGPLKGAFAGIVSKLGAAAAFMTGPWGIAIAAAVGSIIALKVVIDKITKDERDRAQANSVGDSIITLMGKTPTSWDQALTASKSKVKRPPSEIEAFQKKVAESTDGSKDIETLKGVEDKKQEDWLEQKAKALVLADPTEAGIQFAQDYIAAIAEEAGGKAPKIAESVITSLQQSPIKFADAGFELPGSDKKGREEQIQFRINLNESSLETAKQKVKELTEAGKGAGDVEWDYWNSQITLIKQNLVELKGQTEAAGVDFISMGSVASDAMRAAATPAEKLGALLMTVDQNTTAMQASGKGFKEFKDALIAGSPELEKYIKNAEDLNDIIQVLARMSDIDINVNVDTNQAARIAGGVVAGVTGLQTGFKSLTDPFNELMSDESARKSQPGPGSDEVGEAIDNQIKGIEKTIKAHEKAAKARDKQHEADIEAKRDAIEGIENEIDAIDDQIKAINEASAAKQKEIDKQKEALEAAKETADFYRDQQKLAMDYETAIASGDYAAAAGIAVQQQQAAADFGYDQTQGVLDKQSQAISDEAEAAVAGEEAKKEAKQAYIEKINDEIEAINELQEREQEADEAWQEAQQERIEILNENKEAAQKAAAAEQAAWAKTYAENKKAAEAWYAAEQANLAKLASEGKLTTAAISQSARDTEIVLGQLGWSDDRAKAFGAQMELSLMTSWADALKVLGLTPAQMDAVVKATATREKQVRIAGVNSVGGITQYAHGGEYIRGGENGPGLKRDEVHRILQAGEYVVDKRTTKKVGGQRFFDKLKMHTGGLVNSERGGSLGQYDGPPPAAMNLSDALAGAMLGMMEGSKIVGKAIGISAASKLNDGTMTPPVVSGSTKAMAAANRAIADAVNEVGYCLRQVREWWQISGKYGSAIAAWNNAKTKSTSRTPPTGAPVFWSGGQYGHVALSLGNGYVRSTDAAGRGLVGTRPIDWFEKNWGQKYLGWTGDLNDITLPLRKGGKIRYDNTLSSLHRGERVLTEPNTANLDEALKKLARVSINPGDAQPTVSNNNPVYNLNVNVAGTNASAEQISTATIRALQRAEKERDARVGMRR
jgi:hypothetical protein